MLKHVRFLYIIQGDLVSGEGLRSPEHQCIDQLAEKVRAYLRDGESPPHRSQDTANVVRSESIDIFGAVEVSDPEAR
jgi:hypothetical protein